LEEPAISLEVQVGIFQRVHNYMNFKVFIKSKSIQGILGDQKQEKILMIYPCKESEVYSL